MHAGSKFNWHEITKQKISSAAEANLPVFAAVFSSEKGPETITELAADDFFKMYGKTADFSKYGQPLLQAHAILNAGGKIFGCRLVADDATLANLIITAEISTKETNKTNANGEQLYLDSEGNETTEVTDTPVIVTSAVIKYAANTVKNAKDMAYLKEEAAKLATDSVFPLFVIADNGRGVSVKRVKITPDYTTSKTLNYCMYNIVDMENNAPVESVRFSVNPNATFLYNGDTKSMNLVENSTEQFRTNILSDQVQKFVEKLSTISGYAVEELYRQDVLFGCTQRGVKLTGIELAEDSLSLSHVYGLELLSGTNGEFGDAPFAGETACEAWANKAVAYFNGDLDDEVWDLDIHKVDFIVDANYPVEVKAAIADYAHWRKDGYYFRDLGTDVWTYDDVVTKLSADYCRKTPFAGDYLTTYEVIDPYSKKQIRVTMMYDIAPLLVSHYGTNIAAPLAGEFNGFVITNAIENTINFAPRNTPKVKMLDMLEDLRVNFATLSTQNRLVVQALYTSQDHEGPLSYANNVILTQMAVKAIRNYTPKIRFQLMESNDFGKYKQLIDDNVLAQFGKYFQSIELVYTKDDNMSMQKIFNASIECYYKTFAKSEIFDVYAIEGTPDGDTSDYVTNVIDISEE